MTKCILGTFPLAVVGMLRGGVGARRGGGCIRSGSVAGGSV